jgi:hypothetical protein
MRFRSSPLTVRAKAAATLWRSALGAVLLCLSIPQVRGELPKQLPAFGLTLGQPPAIVRSVLSQRYPSCGIVPSIYHESPGYLRT